MVTKLNPAVITDDMMYEGIVGLYDDAEQLRITNEISEQRIGEQVQRVKEDKFWGEIRRAAKTNQSLQAALDHAIMIYKLSKEYKDGI
jgi:hypothetical protein